MRNQILKDTLRTRLAAVLLLAFAFLPAAEAGGSDREQWYVLSLGGRPVGSIEETFLETPAELRVESRMIMVLNRLGSRVEIGTSAAFVESASGWLRSADSDVRMSSQSTSTAVRVGDGVVRIQSTAGGKSFERTLAFEGELAGPEGIRRRTRERLKKPGDSFRIQTFALELGTVATVTRTAVAAETIASEGRDVQALKVEEQISGYPAKRTLWLDGEGRLLASEEPHPFGTMRVFRADAATARRVGQEGGALPDEVYAESIARTQIRLPDPRRIEWLKLRLDHRNPDLGWPAFDQPGHRVVEKTARTLVLEVSRPRPVYGASFPVPATDANREFLEPNTFIQSDDPEVRATAREIVGGETDLFRAALKLERWVAENMTFDPGIVLAPSVEVFKNRRGTCIGYATLLTTLARAAGIPARLVLGYVYVDGMFGGHAWAEVLVGDAWLPLDSAIVAPGTADAARFAFASSSLAEGTGLLGGGGGALQLYGQIEARVLGYALEGGPRVAVAEDARPWSVTGDVYRNEGLGIELRKPAGSRFVKLDAVWPDKTLVGIEGTSGKVALETRARWPWEEAEAAASRHLEPVVSEGRRGRIEVAGRPAYIAEGPDRAAVAIPGPEVVWVLKAEGTDAGALVRQVAAGLRM